MKVNTFIVILLGVAIVCAAAALSGCTGGSNAPTPTPKPMKTTTDVLEKFDLLKERVNASGLWFGGAATQQIMGDNIAMVYVYKPVGSSDVTDLLGGGYSALYSVFETEDPLLVGVIDTTQKINAQQYKVDVYAMERPLVELYTEGNITRSELVRKALFVTPQMESLHTSNATGKQATPLPKPTKNYTPPVDRQAYTVESLNKSGYKGGLQTGTLTDGSKAVNLLLAMPAGLSNAEIYKELDSAFKVCAEAFGDYDRFYISLVSEAGDEYYVVDASALPVVDYANGDISQYELYKNINLTYYTK
jgi:hypothetical protein